MPEWASKQYDNLSIHPFDAVHSIGALLKSLDTTNPASTAWPAANRAIFIPFRVRDSWRITQAVVGCGTTGSNNFDVGVYDRLGNRIVSSGSVARVASSEVVAALSDTWIECGQYYMALSSDSTGTFAASTPGQTAAVSLLKLGGMKEMASAFPLPDPVTFATLSSAVVPCFSIWRTAI